jgi:hypothetical protein
MAEAPDKAAKTIVKMGEIDAAARQSPYCSQVSNSSAYGAAGLGANVDCSAPTKEVEFTGAEADWVRKNGLTQQNVPPGGQVQGAILFRKDKKEKRDDTYIVRVPVASQIFEFLFPAPGLKR